LHVWVAWISLVFTSLKKRNTNKKAGRLLAAEVVLVNHAWRELRVYDETECVLQEKDG